LLLVVSASPASAFTVADTGFAVADIVATPGVTGIAFDSAGTMHTSNDGGLAYVGTHLYAVSRSTDQIRELDTSGSVVGAVTTSAVIACPDELASAGADLFVTTCNGLFRIRNVNTAPTSAYSSNPGSSGKATHAITISADGVIFATTPSGDIW